MIVQRIVATLAVFSLVLGSTAYIKSIVVPNKAARLTVEGMPYDLHTMGSRIAIGNSESGSNNREVYWDGDMPETATATMCATWISGSGIGQNGFAFRIAQRQDGGFNAVVLTRNVWANAYWMFNVAMFYTGDEYSAEAHTDNGSIAKPYSGPWGIDLSQYLGMTTRMVYPLRVCASLDEHNVLRFAVAKSGDQMPPLHSPGNQGGSWELNLDKYFHAEQGLSGRHGIYAGHVPLGTSLLYDDLKISM